MKKLIIIALVFSLVGEIHAHKNADGETRSATVTVDVDELDQINIQAKHTELSVETWNKNQVEVEATIRFDGKLTDRMQKFLDEFEENVSENIRKSPGELLIKTNLDEPNKVQIGSKHVGIIFSYGDNELKISYKIKAPGKNKFVINNSYEDAILNGTYEEVEFTQYSGKLKAGTIKTAKMNLKYGSAEIESLETAELEIYEQEIDANNIGELTINTKYSDLELKEVGVMRGESYESDIVIGLIDKLDGDFKYGEIKIVGKLGEAKLTLYEVDIEGRSVGSLTLENSKYSKFEIEKMDEIAFSQSYEDETDIGSLGSFTSQNSKYGNHSIDMLNTKFDLNAYEDEVDIDRIANGVTSISIKGKYIDASLGAVEQSFDLTGNVKYGRIDYDRASVDVKRYIKDGDKLEVDVQSKLRKDNPLKIVVDGYEIDVTIH